MVYVTELPIPAQPILLLQSKPSLHGVRFRLTLKNPCPLHPKAKDGSG